MGFEIKVQFNHFEQIAEAMKKNTQKAVDETAEEILNDARGHAARHSGSLHDSLYVSTKDHSTYADAAGAAEADNKGVVILPEETTSQEGEAIIGVAAGHGLFVEHGTVHEAARPFLTPAAEGKRSAFLDKLAARLAESEGA